MKESDVIKRWVASPKLFVREALRVERISQQQEHGLDQLGLLVNAKLKRSAGKSLTDQESAVAGKVGISIMSGHGTGKDAWTAWAILWFLCCFPFPKIPCTAPTQHQLRDILWGEIHKWMRHAHNSEGGFKIMDWLTWQSERVFLTEHAGREWYAVARTCNTKAAADEQAETVAGFHEDYMMIVADEASGVPDPVYRPLEATMTGKLNFAILIFNPTRSTGFAIETQQKDRTNWICLRWNAEESELVTQESINRIAKKYGKTSNAYRIRVLGLPPLSDPDTLIQWDWIMDAVGRDIVPLDDDPVVIGIDVARFGDDKSIILPRHGGLVLPIQEYSGLDTEQVAGWAMGAMFEYEPVYTFVDTIGLGSGVADKLRHRTTFNIIDVNVSEVPASADKYRKLRDELWWRLREMFEKRVVAIPDDAELIGELGSIRYQMPSGKIEVESKKALKVRGLDSPNKADALMLTQYFDTEWLRGSRRRPERPRQRAYNWKVV